MFTGKAFKMTLKTRLFLWFYRQFGNISQWFISHCDMEPFDVDSLRPSITREEE